MKSASAGFITHLGEEVLYIKTLFRLTRQDGTQHHFTDHDKDITIDVDGNGDQTYLASSGYSRSSIHNTADMSVDNLEVIGHLDPDFALISEADIRAGLVDFAQVEMWLVNYLDLSLGVVKLRTGYLGEVSLKDDIYFAELRGLVQLLVHDLVEVTSPQCRADLGDHRCKVPISPPFLTRNTAVPVSFEVGDRFAVDTTLDGMSSDPSSPSWQVTENLVWKVIQAGTTAGTQPAYAGSSPTDQVADGTAVLEAEEAFKRFATVSNVVDNSTFDITVTEPRAVDDWFNFGAVQWETGNNAGVVRPVKDWVNSTMRVTLEEAAPFTVEVGDEITIYRGCDKGDDCNDVFGNINNQRAERFIPGIDKLLRVPDPPN